MNRASLRLILATCSCSSSHQPSAPSLPRIPSRKVLVDQQSAWNQGDIVSFMHGYDDSPQTTFIGRSVEHGYAMILARYQRNYASHDAMGQLAFSELDVRLLGSEHAVVTGHFHLTRSQAGGGDASGNFSLVFEKKAPVGRSSSITPARSSRWPVAGTQR
jgi:hypothetical protein